MSKQHKTKYTVTNLKTGGVQYFNTLASAKCYCLQYGYYAPLQIREPIYQDVNNNNPTNGTVG